MAELRELRNSFGRFALAALAVALTGLVAGLMFGRLNPDRAASTLIADFVVDEDVGSPPQDPHAPTSGRSQARARCGVSDRPVDPAIQLATLEAGGVVVQYRPQAVSSAERNELHELAGPDAGVLVAPNPQLGNPVTATAWTRRLPLKEHNGELTRAFVAAFASSEACAPGDGE